jgi:hypothetical protein
MASGTFLVCQTAHAQADELDAPSRNTLDSLLEGHVSGAGTSVA